MKLLHTSDWHLGRVLHEASLEDEQRGFLGQLLAVLRDDPHDVLVVAGDVFDRAIPPESAIALWSRFLLDLRTALPSLPVVVISGNHDSGARLAQAAGLLELSGLHVRGEPHDLARPIVVRGADGDEAELFAIPFLWPGALATHAEHEEIPLSTQEASLAEALRRARAARSGGRLHVAIAHGFVVGGTVSESERTLIGQAVQVPLSVFDGFDYVALGHLHRPQRLSDRVRYSGSPLPYSFSEHRDEKCFLSVTLRADAPPEVRALPIALPRRMVVLRGSLAELETNPDLARHVDDYVCAELTDEGPLASPFATLRRRFPRLLKLDVVATTGRSPTAPATPSASRGPSDPRADFVAFAEHLGTDAQALEALEACFVSLAAGGERGR